MLGNQNRSIELFVLFLLCTLILSPLEVVSHTVFDEFTQLKEVRNFSRIPFTLLGTFLDFLVDFDYKI